ncbi:hypothetical protein M422DRAFT_265885 [Sphaerobolus stellatus SS14]|uniref:Uncharacterized protein n=1 Tax=Sphaerobolus stellatus (strain SS14) TaxID=990650 RepID=A0A0C9TQ51_SPHS4|nr:hypothetical protein M422DRAFT_265885 [Sphaerobolus stellatus SS14]
MPTLGPPAAWQPTLGPPAALLPALDLPASQLPALDPPASQLPTVGPLSSSAQDPATPPITSSVPLPFTAWCLMLQQRILTAEEEAAENNVQDFILITFLQHGDRLEVQSKLNVTAPLDPTIDHCLALALSEPQSHLLALQVHDTLCCGDHSILMRAAELLPYTSQTEWTGGFEQLDILVDVISRLSDHNGSLYGGGDIPVLAPAILSWSVPWPIPDGIPVYILAIVIKDIRLPVSASLPVLPSLPPPPGSGIARGRPPDSLSATGDLVPQKVTALSIMLILQVPCVPNIGKAYISEGSSQCIQAANSLGPYICEAVAMQIIYEGSNIFKIVIDWADSRDIHASEIKASQEDADWEKQCWAEELEFHIDIADF